jgi:hypothetical protein
VASLPPKTSVHEGHYDNAHSSKAERGWFRYVPYSYIQYFGPELDLEEDIEEEELYKYMRYRWL